MSSQIKHSPGKPGRFIESYPGNCACPYNHARNGSRCGGRSAYSRNGGYDVVCYEGDVTDEMIRQWKQENAE
ncbi:hypothetical protein [Escherichia coli]|uniref:hypothetical protein n=1 Tax=Escherichia coli TaxID=562 RepID=UPI003D80A779